MGDIGFSGDLVRTPLAMVLAGLWRQERSGFLKLRRSGILKQAYFDRGMLAVERGSFPEKEFLDSLFASGVIDLVSLARCEDHARKRNISLLRALGECGGFDALRLWGLVEAFGRAHLLAVFDWSEGEFAFEPGRVPRSHLLVGGIPLPDLVLEGVRRMSGSAVIDAHLPAAEEPIQRTAPYDFDRLPLAAHERYLWAGLEAARPLGAIVEESELGPVETRRVLFAFFALGLAAVAKPRNKSGPSPSDYDRLFAAFNDRSAAVFRYISKELGPVGAHVMEKALEEVRGRLDPVCQAFQLQPDGRLEAPSPLKLNLNLGGDDVRRSFLRSLDEILAAEVLAVKRTLGPAHEADLVRNLERLGEGL